MIRHIKVVLVFMVALMGVSLNSNAQQNQLTVEQRLAEFRAWMQSKGEQADSTIRKEWPSLKQEYKEFTSSLDQQTRGMTESSKQEYTILKSRYQEWEERNENRKAVDLDGDVLRMWERKMTGTTHISGIKPVNLREAYLQAIEYTRENRRSWNLRDWDYAEFVFGELYTRKTELLDKLKNSDKIKLAALQVEFVSLKKGREAKELYQDMREEKR